MFLRHGSAAMGWAPGVQLMPCDGRRVGEKNWMGFICPSCLHLPQHQQPILGEIREAVVAVNPPRYARKASDTQEMFGSRKSAQRRKEGQEHNRVGRPKLDKTLWKEAVGQLPPERVRL